ncbi:MAG: hypothetical protein IPK60_12870 [Sandaracinaceae bacterium]|jgi:hypothetical protein|nr:hypothetical protein [Sandaracinaceae bacterium]
MTSRVLLFIASVLALSACSNEVAPSSHEAPADVIYESSATHEVWERLDEATVLGTEAMGPQLTAPVGPLVRSGEPVAFTWTESEAALELRHRKSMLHAPSRLALVLRDLCRPVAHAHTPVTGDMYRAIFTIPGVETPVRVLTGATTYTPSADAWQRITAATGPITLTLEYAYLDTGHITDGPYRGPVNTLTLE